MSTHSSLLSSSFLVLIRISRAQDPLLLPDCPEPQGGVCRRRGIHLRASRPRQLRGWVCSLVLAASFLPSSRPPSPPSPPFYPSSVHLSPQSLLSPIILSLFPVSLRSPPCLPILCTSAVTRLGLAGTRWHCVIFTSAPVTIGTMTMAPLPNEPASSRARGGGRGGGGVGGGGSHSGGG